MKLETQYKKEFRKLVGVWSEVYEPTRGSGLGYPDVQLLVDRKLLPVELKVGKVVGGMLMPEEVRPSQISWHHAFAREGGHALVLVCTGKPSAMDAWAIPSVRREVLSIWRKGYVIGDCIQWISRGSMRFPLDSTYWDR